MVANQFREPPSLENMFLSVNGDPCMVAVLAVLLLCMVMEPTTASMPGKRCTVDSNQTQQL
eukprot:4165356-Amphidinium_carterae.1